MAAFGGVFLLELVLIPALNSCPRVPTCLKYWPAAYTLRGDTKTSQNHAFCIARDSSIRLLDIRRVREYHNYDQKLVNFGSHIGYIG